MAPSANSFWNVQCLLTKANEADVGVCVVCCGACKLMCGELCCNYRQIYKDKRNRHIPSIMKKTDQQKRK